MPNCNAIFLTFRGERKLAKRSYCYKPEQVDAIASSQSARTGLATRVAYGTGLRVHELLAIRPKSEQPASTPRKRSSKQFSERSGEAHIVVGRCGLVWEIRLPGQLAKALERNQLNKPRIVVNRGTQYNQHYGFSGGVYFSFKFGNISKEVLGWSTVGGYCDFTMTAI